MSKTLAIVNHSGGSGKTTTAFWLAKHLSEMGADVTLIDADAQGDLTAMCGGLTALGTLFDVLTGRNTINGISQHTGAAGCNLVASDDRLTQCVAWMQAQTPNHTFMRDAIKRANGDRLYIIDCAPSLDVMMVNALVAADAVIVACNAEDKAARAAGRVTQYIADLNQQLQMNTRILGAAVTQVPLRQGEAYITKNATAIDEIMRHAMILAMIPRRDGQDAARHIGEAYRPVAQSVGEEMGIL